MARKKKGYFSISAVSEMIGIHQQTIRMYEREGLISPKRSDGNTRMFSEEDVERLELIIFYTNKMGVNLAGVEIILKMQKNIDKLQGKMNNMLSDTENSSKNKLDEFKNEMNDVFYLSKKELEDEKANRMKEVIDARDKLINIKNKKNNDNKDEDEENDE